MALNYESCKIHIGYGGEKSHSATTATTHLYPKSNTERRNTMSTKSTSFFKKLLGSLLSAACLFSGTAVAGTIATTSAALPVAPGNPGGRCRATERSAATEHGRIGISLFS